MIQNREDVLHFDIVGKTIAGILCYKFHKINNVVIVYDAHNNSKVITLSSVLGKCELYKIEGQTIDNVQVTEDGKMFLFTTKQKQYLVNDQNCIVENSSEWDDSYFDILANNFYRKDIQGHWYDIEGHRMLEKVFLKEDVLISLETKRSKQSLSFKNQNLYISKNRQLIQIGKLVLDLSLNIVKYFGEKITGLGSVNISFEGKDVLQEIKLGLDNSAFINEFSHQPFLFGDTVITKHLSTYYFGKKRVVVFQANNESYGVEGSSNNFFTYKDQPLQIKSDSHVNFNSSDLIKVSDGKSMFYLDLNTNEPFDLPGLSERNISDIDSNYIRIGNSKVFNVSDSSRQFVILESDGSLFKLDQGTVGLQRVEDIEGLKKYFGFAVIDEQRKMFSKREKSILKFGKDELEVAEVFYNQESKFVNAVDTNGNKLVLDMRLGYDDVKLAKVDDDKISEAVGSSMVIGGRTLINVRVEKLGRDVNRVIVIDDEILTYFTLPAWLKQNSDQETLSVFASNYISQINFSKETNLENKIFISATFMAFTGKEYPVILERDTGAPLHLEGIGHRNELATNWVDYTIHKPIFLGENRMVGVSTIREDQKESKLLFSVQKLTSWLPFFENYLPIFKQVIQVDINEKDNWDYHLFELKEISKDKEYIAVEKIPPYRILADRKSSEYFPRIVKGKKKSIKSPDEMTALQRFFYIGSGFLVEVE